MTLGEKIKKSRIEQKLTQSELCGTVITRNMLSCIENNKATPSLETLGYIADRLSLPISYLVSEDDDLFFYQKKHEIKSIRSAYKFGKYEACIDRISRIVGTDDELIYLQACCNFELGRSYVLRGSLRSAKRHLSEARAFCDQTIYDTRHIKHLLPMYMAIADNIQSPLLELDSDMFTENADSRFETEFYHYISGDFEYDYRISYFANHVKAKSHMKERDYFSALNLMREIENSKTAASYNACVVFGVYTDMEICYKQLADFENAYRYANKRISMIEGFKS